MVVTIAAGLGCLWMILNPPQTKAEFPDGITQGWPNGGSEMAKLWVREDDLTYPVFKGEMIDFTTTRDGEMWIEIHVVEYGVFDVALSPGNYLKTVTYINDTFIFDDLNLRIHAIEDDLAVMGFGKANVKFYLNGQLAQTYELEAK